jgi:hypothetical protein
MLAGIASVMLGMRLVRMPMSMLACTPAGCEEAEPAAQRRALR